MSLDGGLRPAALYRPGEIMISPWSYQSLGVPLFGTGNPSPIGANFITANLGVFIPFGVPEPVTITKLFWMNGTAVAGNLDAAIYDTAGNRLVSTGSTAQAATSACQLVDVTDLQLARGLYYFGFASDTSGATQKIFSVIPVAGIVQSLGLLQQASAFPLPNPATFAKYASAFVPVVGAQGYRTFGP